MHYHITHETVYHFKKPVFFEPHFLRFKPKNTPFIEIKAFELVITPGPTGLSESVDVENNFVHMAWFDGLNDQMKITAKLTIATREYNPYNFIIYPQDYLKVPFHYSEAERELLGGSLEAEKPGRDLMDFGERIIHESNSNTVEFLSELTRQIHQDFSVEYRETGVPFHPDKTFRVKRGSCRDVAWMQVHLLRQLGLASRFVSGYFYLEAEKPEPELHAWLEVYIPGAGWIGFDPSHGIVAGNNHIPVASSVHYENTMSVTGSIRGDASSELLSNVTIEKIVTS